MASIDDDKPTTSQIEKLNGGNYRSWATTMRAILREKKLFDIVDGIAPMPAAPVEGAPAADVTKYRADKDAWESKAMKACTILLSSIKGNLITYVEDEDNPATIWRILKDRFRPDDRHYPRSSPQASIRDAHGRERRHGSPCTRLYGGETTC